VDVQYQDLAKPLDIPPVALELTSLLPEKYSPLTEGGSGTQGYLFSIPPRAGRRFLDLVGSQLATQEPAATAIEKTATLPSTEREALIKSRVGQGPFRDAVIKYGTGTVASLGLIFLASSVRRTSSPGGTQTTPNGSIRTIDSFYLPGSTPHSTPAMSPLTMTEHF
jgi:hypothetical protein